MLTRCKLLTHSKPFYASCYTINYPDQSKAALLLPARPQPGPRRSFGGPDLPLTLYMDVRPAGPRLRSSPSSCALDLLGFGLGALGAAGSGLAPGTAFPRTGVSGLGITWLCASADVLQTPQAFLRAQAQAAQTSLDSTKL